MKITVTMLQREFVTAHEKAKEHPIYENYKVVLKKLDGFTHHGETFVSAEFTTKTRSNATAIDLFDNLGYLDNTTDFARIETEHLSLEG